MAQIILTALAPPDEPASQRDAFLTGIAIVNVHLIRILALVGQIVTFPEEMSGPARFTVRAQLVVVANLA